MFADLIRFIRDYYATSELIPLHAPVFAGSESDYVLDTINSTFVSSVGAYVDRFEKDMELYTGSPGAVAVVNGTAALHVSLRLAGVGPNDLVITQPLTFVATCNAIVYCGAEPVFVDVDRDTLGLSPRSMREWLEQNAFIDDDGFCRHRVNQKIIRACLPMHTFGHPADLSGLQDVCQRWHLVLVEDAAESLGSVYHGQHTGTFGLIGVLSFNGNKIITTGGGGMILTDKELAQEAKHLSTTGKQPHPFEYVHDRHAYNYRLPNLNAALGCAQLEQMESFLCEKRRLAGYYEEELKGGMLEFVKEPPQCRSNYWLNAVICQDQEQRDELLKVSNQQGVMTRPVWRLMNRLPMYVNSLHGSLEQAKWLEARIVNLPSSVRMRA